MEIFDCERLRSKVPEEKKDFPTVFPKTRSTITLGMHDLDCMKLGFVGKITQERILKLEQHKPV